MAFQITKSTPYDVDATYWRITDFQANREANTTNANLGGFVSKASADLGAEPLTKYPFLFGEFLEDRSSIYLKMKEVMDADTSEWSGYQDILEN